MRPSIEASRGCFTRRSILLRAVSLPLAFTLSGCVTDGQTGFESAMSSVSQNVAPLLAGFSPQAGDLVASLDTSPAKQQALAEKSAAEIERQYPRVHDPKLESYLTAMARKLAGERGTEGFDYEVAIIQDDQLNAFTVGAGRLYVTTGLLAALNNEAQMAAVLGHEIGHVTEGHVARAQRDQTLIAAAGGTGTTMLAQTSLAGGVDQGAVVAGSGMLVGAAINGYGRQQEEDADRLGLQYMVQAGYNPNEMPAVFEIFEERFGDQPGLVNFFHGDHPLNATRIQMTERIIAANYAGDVENSTTNTKDYKKLVAKYK
jgi:beta-barrel assembly-enhancing protease